jgi:hypothetical protein
MAVMLARVSPVMEMVLPVERTVFWFIFTLVALVVPMLRVVAVAVSRVGVRMLVLARPVPDIQKFEAA